MRMRVTGVMQSRFTPTSMGLTRTQTPGRSGTWSSGVISWSNGRIRCCARGHAPFGLTDLYIGAPGLFKKGLDGKPQPQKGVSANNLMVGRGGTELTEGQIQTVVNLNAEPTSQQARLMKSVINAMHSSGLEIRKRRFLLRWHYLRVGFPSCRRSRVGSDVWNAWFLIWSLTNFEKLYDKKSIQH